MKIIKESSSQEAILEWLRAELNSARFSNDLYDAIEKLGYDEKIITVAQLHNKQENEVRWRILKSYRSWLDIDFGNYEWQQVELSREDVSDLSYIDYSYWNELSDGTRKVGRAADNVAKGKIVFDVPLDGFFSIAQAVEAGTTLPPIIVVSSHVNDTGEILEGHLRATGYMLAARAKHPLKAIRGRLQ